MKVRRSGSKTLDPTERGRSPVDQPRPLPRPAFNPVAPSVSAGTVSPIPTLRVCHDTNARDPGLARTHRYPGGRPGTEEGTDTQPPAGLPGDPPRQNGNISHQRPQGDRSHA